MSDSITRKDGSELRMILESLLRLLVADVQHMKTLLSLLIDDAIMTLPISTVAVLP